MSIRAMIALFVISLQSHADSMTWCAYYNWNPWIYLSGKDTYAGVLIDQLNLFKKTYPEITVEAKIIENWQRCQAEVASGNVTLVLGANKTPERQAVFDYLPEPAFVNVSTLGVYAAQENDNVTEITTLDHLRKYRLAMIRGNSYGSEVDPFIKSLAGDEINEVSSQGQVLTLVAMQRYDYFFIPDAALEKTITLHSEKYPELTDAKFKKVFEIKRATPAYYVFGKNTANYDKYAHKWLRVLEQYYTTVNREEEILRHKTQAK